MCEISENKIKQSRLMYIFEAAIEYLISILTAGAFLASLTKELGLSDSLTGILSSIVSLGCMFQLVSISIRKKSIKRLVLLFSIINQLLFMLLYVIPITNFSSQTKMVLFVILIFTAYFIYNVAHPKKINWLMSLVDDRQRGRFTANKEIISLISGMVFSFGMGAVIDHCSAIGKTRLAFIISAIVILVLTVLHSLTMIFAVEIPMPNTPAKKINQVIRELVRNKSIVRITVLFFLYYISTYISTPFYGTYMIGELGFNLKFVSAITMCGSLSRIFVSRFWGRYADRSSFATMVEKCLIFLALSEVCVVFAVPSTGRVMFVLYHVLHGIALGGINSALINLIFDYVPTESRADSIAITQALAGIVGFLTTLCISPVITLIQNNGNTLFGVSIYAQQLVTALALIFTVTAIFYTRIFLRKE